MQIKSSLISGQSDVYFSWIEWIQRCLVAALIQLKVLIKHFLLIRFLFFWKFIQFDFVQSGFIYLNGFIRIHFNSIQLNEF